MDPERRYTPAPHFHRYGLAARLMDLWHRAFDRFWR